MYLLDNRIFCITGVYSAMVGTHRIKVMLDVLRHNTLLLSIKKALRRAELLSLIIYPITRNQFCTHELRSCRTMSGRESSHQHTGRYCRYTTSRDQT